MPRRAQSPPNNPNTRVNGKKNTGSERIVNGGLQPEADIRQ